MTNNTYTVYARFPGDIIEELDIDAPNEESVLEKARKELDEDYLDGWVIEAIERRIGLYY